MNWGMRICQYGEITGFIGTGYLIATGYYLLSVITFMVSMYLGDCFTEKIKGEEDKGWL